MINPGEETVIAGTDAHRHGRPLTAVVLDIDDFKAFNDRGGHDTGDRALIGLAERLRNHLRAGDLIARLGGDEFAAVLTDTDQLSALAAIGRLQAAPSMTRESIGLARLLPGETLQALLTRADVSLCEIKRQTKGTIGVSVCEAPDADDRPKLRRAV